MKKQNVILKVGIGLVLGIGALVIAPQAAQATPPCTPGGPVDSALCATPAGAEIAQESHSTLHQRVLIQIVMFPQIHAFRGTHLIIYTSHIQTVQITRIP